jgi:hypothetical protein
MIQIPWLERRIDAGMDMRPGVSRNIEITRSLLSPHGVFLPHLFLLLLLFFIHALLFISFVGRRLVLFMTVLFAERVAAMGLTDPHPTYHFYSTKDG